MVQQQAASEGSNVAAAIRRVRRGCRVPRSLGAICLVCIASEMALGACDNDSGETLYRARPLPGGGRGDVNRGVRPGPGKGGDDSWWGRQRSAEPDASAGSSGKLALDAGVGDAGAATAPDATAPPENDASAPDAGELFGDADPALSALSDAQILRVADVLDAIEIERAQAVSALLTSPELQAFAQEMLDQHQLARDSWRLLAGALDLVPSDSALSDDVQTSAEDSLQQLLSAEPEALAALYLSTEIDEQGRAIELSSQLSDVADAEPLRAQLLVWRTIASDQRAAAKQLAADLADRSAAGPGEGTSPALPEPQADAGG